MAVMACTSDEDAGLSGDEQQADAHARSAAAAGGRHPGDATSSSDSDDPHAGTDVEPGQDEPGDDDDTGGPTARLFTSANKNIRRAVKRLVRRAGKVAGKARELYQPLLDQGHGRILGEGQLVVGMVIVEAVDDRPPSVVLVDEGMLPPDAQEQATLSLLHLGNFIHSYGVAAQVRRGPHVHHAAEQLICYCCASRPAPNSALPSLRVLHALECVRCAAVVPHVQCSRKKGAHCATDGSPMTTTCPAVLCCAVLPCCLRSN
jgi:hypothetical protein